MANPQNSGVFNKWITNRIPFKILTPKTIETGLINTWVTSRIPFNIIVEPAASGGSSSNVPLFMMTYRRRR